MKKLGLIAGNGFLPKKIIEHCLHNDRQIIVVSIDPEPDDIISKIPNIQLNISSVGKAIKFFNSHDVQEIVFAGGLIRPKLSELRPDASGIKLLSRITKAKFNGDNKLLSTILDFFEEEGFSIIGAHEIVTDLLAPKGVIGKMKPTKGQLSDIEVGVKIAKSIGELDIGQAVIVQDKTIIGVEAIEGTDNLIKRCKELQFKKQGAILVKTKKPNQDQRIDLPTVGVKTVLNAHQNNLSAIAIEAGQSLIIDKEQVIKTANKHNILLIGY